MYKSRPSRTQQLLHPSKRPKLIEAAQEETARQCVPFVLLDCYETQSLFMPRRTSGRARRTRFWRPRKPNGPSVAGLRRLLLPLNRPRHLHRPCRQPRAPIHPLLAPVLLRSRTPDRHQGLAPAPARVQRAKFERGVHPLRPILDPLPILVHPVT